MAEPGLYKVGGVLFVATHAPECFAPGQPGVLLDVLKGYCWLDGRWQSRQEVLRFDEDGKLESLQPCSPREALAAILADAPGELHAVELPSPVPADEDLKAEIERLQQILGATEEQAQKTRDKLAEAEGELEALRAELAEQVLIVLEGPESESEPEPEPEPAPEAPE